MSTRRAITTAAAPPPAGGYSQGIVVGEFLFTAGMGPADPRDGQIPEGIRAQTHQVMRNLAAVLDVYGLGFADVVKTTAHLQELHRDFADYDEVYRSYLGDPLPARTTVGSQLMNMLVEIDVVAHLPQT